MANNTGILTFALAGFLIASVIAFSLVALPELLPAVIPALRTGTLELQVTSSSSVFTPSSLVDLRVTVNSMNVHLTGAGEGAWIPILQQPTIVKPLDIGSSIVTFTNAKIGIGEYNVLQISLGEANATIRGSNVTLTVPSQDLRIPTDFLMREGKLVTLVLDFSYDPDAVLSRRFDPHFTVSVGGQLPEPSETTSKLVSIASFGPRTLGPGESAGFSFTIQPGAEAQNYLLNVNGGSAPLNTFEVDIYQTGEFWYTLSGNLWFLGGNLTAGSYNVTTIASQTATDPVTISLALYRIPRMPTELNEAVFSGLDPGERSPTLSVNEFAVYVDESSLYYFGLNVKSGDYQFLVDNNPVAVVQGSRTVTFQLEQGLHIFQILADFLGTGRDTSWVVSIIPVPNAGEFSFSREARIATALLAISAILLVVDVARRRFASRK